MYSLKNYRFCGKLFVRKYCKYTKTTSDIDRKELKFFIEMVIVSVLYEVEKRCQNILRILLFIVQKYFFKGF